MDEEYYSGAVDWDGQDANAVNRATYCKAKTRFSFVYFNLYNSCNLPLRSVVKSCKIATLWENEPLSLNQSFI